MELSRPFRLITLTLLLLSVCSLASKPLLFPSEEEYTEEKALGMIKASRGVLAPVYGPLAEQIAADFKLGNKVGIGIDIGGGPGTLIIELCKRSQLHWVNADINPHFFPYFYKEAEKCGFGHRVSAIFADAQALPFRSNYANIIISRGSFHLWSDKVQAFREIYRVLKPGSAAYIGRGFSENFPVETAKKIRAKQGKKVKYFLEETANELREVMSELGIKEYYIHRPKAGAGEKVNYGIWVEFRKPECGAEDRERPGDIQLKSRR